MVSLRSLTRAVALGGLLLVVSHQTEAQSITPLWVDTSWNSATGISLYNYSLELNPNTAVQTGSSFTFFDFLGLTGTPTFTPIAPGADFNITTSLGSPDPPPGGILAAGGSPNVVLTYDGSAILNPALGPGPINLGTVSIESLQKLYLLGPFSPFGATSATGTNSGYTFGPSSPPIGITGGPDTPEPGALAFLFGSGVAGMAIIRRRRRA
jgi:hypothetical protein